MTATDELRRLLDERGVEYEARTSPIGSIWTYWDAFNGHRVYARDNENGTVKIFGEWDVTPEQAIAATLGTGTCHDKGTFKSWGLFTCSNCSIVFPLDAVKDAPSIGRALPPNFCPHCGARVVSE